MKLLTLNTHSRPERNDACATTLAAWILEHKPDVVALQEVNQSADDAEAERGTLYRTGFLPIEQSAVPLRRNNYAFSLAEALTSGGETYRWCYLPIKRGYQRYDEGVALFFMGEADRIVSFDLSATKAYTDWRRRMALGIHLGTCWFYSLHTSRFDDPYEPFLSQWQRLQAHLQGVKRVFLMGDFNCPADRRGEGYDRIIADGWDDVYTKARLVRGEQTVGGAIDGWRDANNASALRMDFILTNEPRFSVYRCETVLDGRRGAMISDHCGVFCHLEEDGGDDGKNM